MQRPPRRRARSSLLYSPAQDGSHIKWLPLRAELAMNFVPTAREGAPLLLEGLISGYSMSGCIQSGTGFPDGRGLENRVPEFAFGMGCGFRLRALVDNATRNLRSEWDAVSQRGRKRKLHPTPDVNSGTRLPLQTEEGALPAVDADSAPFALGLVEVRSRGLWPLRNGRLRRRGARRP